MGTTTFFKGVLFLAFISGGNILSAQVGAKLEAKEGLPTTQIDAAEYSAMLEESFLAEMNPGAEMARSQPENNAQAVTSKAELISDESGAYKELFGRGETVIRERTIVDYPGYPKYFDTGNPEMDDVAFKIAAEKWAAENAVEFQKISGLIQNSHP